MSNKTFTTSNYSRFKFHNVNRLIDQSHVAKLERSIQKYGLLVPILCDKNDYIVDGQHRFIACMRSGHELTVQVRDSYDMKKIVEVNSTSKRWTYLDYAHHYTTLGNPNYMHYLKCVEQYPKLGKLSVAYACALMQISAVSFQSGNLIVRDKKKTAQILRLMDVARIHGMWAKRHHAAIVYFVQCGYNVENLIERLEKVSDSMKIEKPRNAKDALRVWQDIYNWKRSKNKIKLD